MKLITKNQKLFMTESKRCIIIIIKLNVMFYKN